MGSVPPLPAGAPTVPAEDVAPALDASAGASPLEHATKQPTTTTPGVNANARCLIDEMVKQSARCGDTTGRCVFGFDTKQGREQNLLSLAEPGCRWDFNP
jgi:hypothetical protein